ncbi:MAG: hypothetical protein R3E50_12345 [Halioglobus sp.]
MESLDLLILGVEASIALAGFAGIIATFQFGGAKEIRRSDAVGLTMILQISLMAALHSALTLLLYSFGLQETTLWAVSSVFAVIFQAQGAYSASTKVGPAVRTTSFKLLIAMMQIPSVGMILINVMNASDIYFHREPGPAIASIVWGLSLSGFMFSRLLLIPVWRNVHSQEAAKVANATSA